MFAVVAALYIQVLPWSFGAIEKLTTYIHADFIANFARPGAFSNSRRGSSSTIASARPTARCAACSCRTAATRPRSSTYIAEAGKTVEKDGASYLQLSKGVYCGRRSAAIRRS